MPTLSPISVERDERAVRTRAIASAVAPPAAAPRPSRRCVAWSGQRMPTGRRSCSPGRSRGRTRSTTRTSPGRDGDSSASARPRRVSVPACVSTSCSLRTRPERPRPGSSSTSSARRRRSARRSPRATSVCSALPRSTRRARCARRSARRVLGGERNAVRIDGFDLGNSPREYLEAARRDARPVDDERHARGRRRRAALRARASSRRC